MTEKGRNFVGRLYHHESYHAARSQLPLIYPRSCAGQGQPVLFRMEATLSTAKANSGG